MHKRVCAFLMVMFSVSILFCQTEVNAQAGRDQKENGKIRIASCQFPVSSDIKANYRWIEKQMIKAKLKNADIVHFPECALSGYPGEDFQSLENFNWVELHRMTDSIFSLSKKLKISVLLGSLHRLNGNKKPYISLYVINPEGKLLDRYDKRFCTTADLINCSPGDHFVTFNINGVTCGLLICYDVRFPELYREYRKLGCDVIFQSFYNAREKKGNILPVIMPISAQANAASNYFYMSLTNSSEPESWPCHFITPDGLVKNKLTKNIPGILISDIDITVKYYDASKAFRPDAMRGKLNSGATVNDTISTIRTIIY